MSRFAGGYVGRKPGYNNSIRPGVFTLLTQYDLALSDQWPSDYGNLVFSYEMMDMQPLSTNRSYASGEIVVPREPHTYLTVVHNASFPGLARRPRAAIWYSYRVPTKVTVVAVDAAGAITGFNYEKGKGLRTSKVGTTVSFTGGSGTGAQFTVYRDASNMTTPSLVQPGTGYSVGDILTFTDPMEVDGTQANMDQFWDILVHGVAGDGAQGPREDGRALKSWAPLTTGSNAGWGPSSGATLYGDTTAASASGLPWAASGVVKVNPGYPNYQGGSSGGGWGAGNTGADINADPPEQQSAGDGSSGYSVLNPSYSAAGSLVTTNYGIQGISITIDNVLTFVKDELFSTQIAV